MCAKKFCATNLQTSRSLISLALSCRRVANAEHAKVIDEMVKEVFEKMATGSVAWPLKR